MLHIKTQVESKRSKYIIDSPGIFSGYCMCLGHGKLWREGDNYEDKGGKACRECIEAYLKEEKNDR